MKKFILYSLCVLFPLVSAQASQIIWVTFHPGDDEPAGDAASAGFTEAPDVGYTDLLSANGHSVTRYVTTGTPDVGLLNSAELVIISRSVNSGDYQDDAETAAWNGITAPTLILGGYLLRDSRLGYTTGGNMPDTVGDVTLSIEDPSHPIFSGLTITDNTLADIYAQAVMFGTNVQRGISVNANDLAGGGTLLATTSVGDPVVDGMVIGEWLAGSVMNTDPANVLGGHRMVMLTGSREHDGLTSQGSGIYDLTPTGANLFLNAVNYMAIPEPSTLALLGLGGLAAFSSRRRRWTA